MTVNERASVEIDKATALGLHWGIEREGWQTNDTYLLALHGGRTRLGSPVKFEVVYRRSEHTGRWTFGYAVERTSSKEIRWDTRKRLNSALKLHAPRCRCGARDFHSCLCMISMKAFNATSRAVARLRDEG